MIPFISWRTHLMPLHHTVDAVVDVYAMIALYNGLRW